MQRILFVCTGNTCRSAMAEAILKNKDICGVEVRSSGIFAINGSDASKNAKQVLVENNIEHHHQSTPLSKNEVEWATLILTMTNSHKAAIAASFPDAAQKTFTLKEFVGQDKDWDVSDPYGGDIDIYRETFKELEKLIDEAMIQLKENPST